MNIISRFKYFKKLGSKVFVIPIFAFIAILFSGYTLLLPTLAQDSFAQLPYEPNVLVKDVLTPVNNGLSANLFFSSDSIEVTSHTKIRRSKFRKFKNSEETTIIRRDTISVSSVLIDSTKTDSLAIDSTARLKYFKYKRKDNIAVEFEPQKKFSLYTYPSMAKLRRTVAIDSTGKYVEIKEQIGKDDFKIGLRIPLEEYIELEMERKEREGWDQITSKYEVKTGKEELGDLLSEITNIDIPLPSSSIFSIFGPPKISLRVNGSVDIHGAWRNETTEGVTASLLGNTRNEPDFKQQVQINVSGTVGDKLTLSADWNTERDFQYENQLKLKYTGYEDEIIQSIEAGNVSLQTSPLVGGSEALFGIKALFKMGPFSLTALASQKKGETEEVSLSGGSKSQTFEVHAYDYSKNHFFLHQFYYDPNLNIFNKYYGNPTPQYENRYKIKDIEIWKSITGLADPNERKANAYITLDSVFTSNRRYDSSLRTVSQESIAGEKVIGTRFIKLEEGNQYTINKDAGFISFTTSIQNEEIVAAAFRLEGPTSSDDDDWFYGEFIQDVPVQEEVLVLKLIKPANLQPSFRKAWKLQLKNIYPIGGRDLNKEGFNLDILFQVEGQDPRNDYNGIKLLEAFDLDKTDETGTGAQPDGAFDYFPPRTIMPFTGEIIFPVLEPFGRDLPNVLPDELKYSSVYDTTYNIAKNDREKDKFLIKGEYSASVTSTFNVGFNVVENSVKVFFNGNQLQDGADYTVDYLLGQVKIRKAEALVSGADLRITYEKNDLFQMASKSMLGLRGVYEFNERTKLGFSYLNLNQQTLSDKVRIGEEPLSNTIMGADFQANIDLPFLTDGLDYIMSTKEMSNLSLNAEYAYINPEPNTKKSTIDGDDSKSIAYIDDFEGAKRIIPIGVSYTSWTDISTPNNMEFIGNFDKMRQMDYKAKTFWYNILPSDVYVQDIWGDRKTVARDQEQQTVLDMVIEPTQKGMYNWLPDLSDTRKNWGGLMKRLSSTANNLIDENIEFIEFWVNIVDAPQEGAVLYLDLGQISEDVLPDGGLNTEDLNTNDQIDPGEDVGLDGMTDAQEREFTNTDESDPSGDNFSLNMSSNDMRARFYNANGSEGSAASVDRLLPDTEDLNRNSNLDRLNSYFRYKVLLDTVSSPYLSGGGFGNSGWYLFRIPLKDYYEKIGDPSLSIVESVRLWSNDLTSDLHIRLFEINLVGNQWRKVLVPGKVTEEDEVLTISVINLEDDPEYYSPKGLKQERDRTQTDYEVYKNEQSLRLVVKDLAGGDTREIVKYLFRPLDLFNYKQMKMFFWGDTVAGPDRLGQYDSLSMQYNSELYFRFGTDSLNYYEYRCPVGERWQEIAIKFSELTAIKQERLNTTDKVLIPIAGKKGHYYSLRGNPTLTRVTYFTVGIRNPSDNGYNGYEGPIFGDLWINELRVLEADASPGWAYKTTASFKLADFIKIDANAGQTNPFFHRISERFGNRVDSKDWGITANLNILKLIPFNLSGSNFNLTYSRKESMAKPLFLPGTDVEVSEAVRRSISDPNIPIDSLAIIEKDIRSRTETMDVSENWTLSNVKIKIPSNEWYIRDIINSFTFSFNYNTQSSRNPTTLTNNNWRWDASVSYALNLGPTKYFEPAKWPIIEYFFDIFPDYKNFKIYYTPQTISLGMSANRKWSINQSRTTKLDTLNNQIVQVLIPPNVQRDFISNRNASFSWRLTDGGFWNTTLNYNLNIKSSLTHLLTIDEVDRPESDVWKDIFSKDLFGKDFEYVQVVDFKIQPKLPKWFDLDRAIQVQGGYNVNYSWQNNFQQEDLGKSAKFTSRISANITLKLKQLFEPLLGDPKPTSDDVQTGRSSGPVPAKQAQKPSGSEFEANTKTALVDIDEFIGAKRDSTGALIDSLTIIEEPYKEPFYSIALVELRRGIKWLLFDYEQINVTYNHDNSYGAGALRFDGNGFSNLWGYKHHDFNGPSRMFMLGFSYDAGPRAPSATISDNSTQKNTFDLKTSRKLWEGANLNINWHLDFGFNRASRITTDENGDIMATEITSTGTLNRTFMSFPSTFVFSVFGTEIKKVHDLYDENSLDPTKNLSEAFIQGFEAFPLLAKIPLLGNFAKYLPRPNWSFNWAGLEKISFLNFADKISLSHAYTSNFTEGWKIKADGSEEVQTQKIDYGFSPLIGVTFGMNKLFGGSLNTSFKYSTKASYSLGVATRNITEDISNDISMSITYSKQGFEFPLFGISFKNDLEFSITYTSGTTSTIIYNMDEWRDNGTPQNGQIRTQLEPRMKFQMSQTVTASLFYRRTTFEPEGAARKPPTTTNEMGLDINIQIR